eukprot:GFUD01007652.1.p1 GENE.GFUD01007652.1~~GFUD01007652.1.p1  ORF type:complete len:233 (+),score=27.45 GFUD01007652.1:104-802(+)
MIQFLSIPPGVLSMAILLQSVSGLWGREEPEECPRCRLIEGDLFDNHLWRFYEVRKFTCPEDSDNQDDMFCCNIGYFRPCCSVRDYHEHDSLTELMNCESVHSKVIGLPVPIGGLILVLLVTVPFICICACCRVCKNKRRRNPEEHTPTSEELPMNVEEQPQALYADSNLVLPSVLEQSAFNPQFSPVPGHVKGATCYPYTEEQPPAYAYLYPETSQERITAQQQFSTIKPY